MNTDSSAYRLLTVTALSGECSPDVLSYMDVASTYAEKLITKLKNENYIKVHNKDGLKGYRLTISAKKHLLSTCPGRFDFYLNGGTDTNRPRSDYNRRLRLQQASILYSMFLNTGITVFRDAKPDLFSGNDLKDARLPLPAFYHSREIKELGAESAKINNSRLLGLLMVPQCIFAVFYTGDSLLKWEYRTELKVKALIGFHLIKGILSAGHISPAYQRDVPVKALLIGSHMSTATKLITSRGGHKKSYFYLDNSFDHFHYLPYSHEGDVVLKLLCHPELTDSLKALLVSDLHPANKNLGFDHDATTDAGLPVLLAFDFDMLRITRFHTALSFR